MNTIKTYILDTNVLLHDPNSIYKFQEHTVILPITVIEELDKFKSDSRELGRNARQVARNIKELMDLGDLKVGVQLKTGGTLRVILTSVCKEKADDKILEVAKELNGILVTKDVNLRIKAVANGVITEDYLNDKVDVEGLYTGISTIQVSGRELDELYSKGNLDVPLHYKFFPNQCLILKSIDNPKHSALGRFIAKDRAIRLLSQNQKTMGLLPRNTEQQFALDVLLDPDIKLVTLIGKAGGGKSLLATAAALDGIMETGIYQKLLIARPIVSLNNSHQLGFLPGGLEEKLDIWLQPLYDAIEFIMGSSKKPTKKKNKNGVPVLDEKEPAKTSFVNELKSFGLIELGSLEHIRGRSIPNQIIILDEAQNLTPLEVKTVISRAGEGTKIILTGDIEQIDSAYLDAASNGLTYVAEKFKDQEIAAHITLQKSERSELARIAAEIL